MPKYAYKAKKGPRDVVEGTVDAETYGGAVDKLSKMGYYPISVEEEGPSDTRKDRSLFSGKKRVRPAELSEFTRQISELLASGVPLLQGLRILNQQTANKRFQFIIQDLTKTIRDGGTLSDGLLRHPGLFSSLYINITRAGELGGKLEYALSRLADFMDKEEDMRSRVQQAMAYPALMCAVGFITIFLLMTIVIPRLVVMFEDIGQALPTPTLILVGISNFSARFWWLILLAVGIAIFLIKRSAATAEGRLKVDTFKLGLPMYGPLMRKIEIARLSRTLATLLDSGIPILQALDAVISTVQNEVIKNELKKARQQVKDGASLGKSLSGTIQIPPYVINMITVGEESGQLEKVLYRIAISYETQTDKAVRLLMTLLEPVLILTMGLIVGFIVVSMLLPIFQFNIMIR